MELADYLALIRPYLRLIAAIPVIFFVAGYVLTVQRPPTFEASTTFTVEKPQAREQTASNFYQFDNYYSQLASTIFADTVANWLRSPGPVVEIYQQANLPPPQGSAAQVGRTFRVGKGQDTSVVSLTARATNEKDARTIIEAAKRVITAKVDELKRESQDANYFTVAAAPIQVFAFKTSPAIIAILGAITGLVVALVLAFVLAYLGPARRR